MACSTRSPPLPLDAASRCSSYVLRPPGLLYKLGQKQYYTCATICRQRYNFKSHGHILRPSLNSLHNGSIVQYAMNSPSRVLMDGSKATYIKLSKGLGPFIDFTRPYTLYGTVIGVIFVSLLAIESPQEFSLRFCFGVIQALVPLMLMNMYMVGINQVIDVEIDKINKPYLPLASGELTLSTGISLTIVFATLSFALGVLIGSKPLLWAMSIVFFFSTCYSIELPWLRWKRWASLAALSIVSIRGIAMQIFPFLHMQSYVLGRVSTLNKSIIFHSSMLCIFALVVSFFKDIPDYEGDKAHGMQSFVIQQGPKTVFWFCVSTLVIAYSGAIAICITSQTMWARIGGILGHFIAACTLWHHATMVDPSNKADMVNFYNFIWKLLYAEFVLTQFVR